MSSLKALKTLHRIQRTLLHIQQILDVVELSKRGENDMPISPIVAALITQFDDATTAVAVRIQTLVNNAGLTPEEVSAFQVEIDRLKVLGSDPNNPIPSEPPAVG